MSGWPGKTVFGLTGNIATGKSVVRRMLEHLGAYGIDADALAHRALALGAPGYQPVLDRFGRWILAADGQIDRARLGKIVFSDPEALGQLERIIHPLVGQGVDVLARRARQPVIVIEAIKLLESNLRQLCDAVWVTYAPPDVQMARLMEKRGLTAELARQRIAAQPHQAQKVSAADVVIRNEGSFENTWKQVLAAWGRYFPAVETAPPVPAPARRGELMVQRARPQQAGDIAALINRLSGGKTSLTHDDIMAAFGEKAYLLLYADQRLAGVAGWQVENLVARTNEVYFDPGLPLTPALKAILEQVERESRELQCEISLLYLPKRMAAATASWQELGYQPRSVAELGVRAWQEAALESMPPDSLLLFKQIRKDRVLRPV